MSFKKDNYIVIKKAISKDLAIFLFNYFLMKRQVFNTFKRIKYISPYTEDFGKHGDAQAPNTYAHYADVAMETLLLKLQPIIEKNTHLKLIPNYTYARLYKNKDILERHKDRLECEVSGTLFLGGEPWPIFLEPSGKEGQKGKQINLKEGDLLIYKGEKIEHWREAFTGQDCAQVFLHYNDSKIPNISKTIFDSRKHLGLPLWFKGKANI